MLNNQARFYSTQFLSGTLVWLLIPFTAGRLALMEIATTVRTCHQQQKLKEVTNTAFECKKQLERLEEDLAATEFGLDASFAAWVEIHQAAVRKLVVTYQQFYPLPQDQHHE